MLAVGGRTNSLGRTAEVVRAVLADRSRLEELYDCLFEQDAWLRMRAADALEKVCREHPDWLEPFVDRWARDLGASRQASLQWHLAQVYRQVRLTAAQRAVAAAWLEQLVATADVDWIVAANALDTLAEFTRRGEFSGRRLVTLLRVQQSHTSKSVVKRSGTLLAEFTDAR